MRNACLRAWQLLRLARARQGKELRQVKLVFSEQAWEDYLYWQKIDKKLVQRISDLVKELARTPHTGTGKPEPLKHALFGLLVASHQ